MNFSIAPWTFSTKQGKGGFENTIVFSKIIPTRARTSITLHNEIS